MKLESFPDCLADFFIHFHTAPPFDDSPSIWQPHARYISRHPADRGEYPALRILETADSCFTRLHYIEGLRFTINQAADTVWVSYDEGLSLEYVTLYLTNAVIGLCLRMRDRVCLHASAVAVDDHALVFVGASGAGKSTTAAYFTQHGHALFSDEMCVLRTDDGVISIEPGFPRLRLLPTSTEALLGDAGALKPMMQGWNKQYLDLAEQGYAFAAQPLPVGAIYLLLPRADRLMIDSLSPSKALIMLMSNTYLHYLLDQRARAAEMRALARLVAEVPVRTVAAHHDINRLPELYDHLLRDFRAKQPSTR